MAGVIITIIHTHNHDGDFDDDYFDYHDDFGDYHHDHSDYDDDSDVDAFDDDFDDFDDDFDDFYDDFYDEDFVTMMFVTLPVRLAPLGMPMAISG